MSWTKLAPIARSTGRPMASASVQVDKRGAARISLILAASLKDAYGAPTQCDVLAGHGESAGQVRLEFGSDGAFPVGNFVSGGGRVFLPLTPGVADKAAANAPCRVIAQSVPENVLVLELPLKAWGCGVGAVIEKARATLAPSAPPALPKAMSHKRVMAEILDALGDEPSTGGELVDLVGVGEGQIRNALVELSDNGKVVGSPLTSEGWPARMWRLA